MLGEKETPYTTAPDDWYENGVPYGAFCKCAKCGYVGTSTVTFDYFAVDGVGSDLCCDACRGVSAYAIEKVMRPDAMNAFAEDHPEIEDGS